MVEKTILIVDDEDIIRKLIERLLDNKGYKLCFSNNVAKAIETINSKQIDLLITDLKLPDGNGVDIIKYFNKKNPQNKIIVMTGSPTPEERLSPVIDITPICLFKPFENNEFELAVERSFQ